jgi:hypothetical protein
MKKLLIASLMLSSFAHAGQVVLYNAGTNHANMFHSGSFGLNESLGRAWVEFSTSLSYLETPAYSQRALVKGMSFDKTTQEIIIEDETGRTVCAVQSRGLFGIKKLRNTGDCTFNSEITTTTQDNGFEIVKVEKLKVTLDY